MTATNGETYSFMQNHLGSVHGLADINGVHAASYTYGPYGEQEPVNGGGSSLAVSDPVANRNVFRYTGREGTYTNDWGPSGEWGDSVPRAYHYRSRQQIPELGQFNRMDDYRPVFGNHNLYGYVEGNPVNYVDPFGWAVVILGVTLGAKAAFGFGLTLGATAVLTLYYYTDVRDKDSGDDLPSPGDPKGPHTPTPDRSDRGWSGVDDGVPWYVDDTGDRYEKHGDTWERVP